MIIYQYNEVYKAEMDGGFTLWRKLKSREAVVWFILRGCKAPVLIKA